MKKTALFACLLIFVSAMCVWGQLFATESAMPARDFSPLGTNEYKQLESMLAELQLQPGDLNYEKDWDLSTWGKGKRLLRALQEPYYGLDLQKDIRETAYQAKSDEGLARMLDKLQLSGFGTREAIDIYLTAYRVYYANYMKSVAKPKDIFTFYEKSIDELIPGLASAFSDLKRDDWAGLVSYLMAGFMESEDEDAYKAYFARQQYPLPDSLDSADIKEYMESIYEPAIIHSAFKFLALAQVLKNEAPKLGYKNKKPLFYHSRFGSMAIGTTGDDTYTDKQFKSPLILLIEPGGNDSYRMQLNTGYENYFYLLMDFAGADFYDNGDIGGMFFANSGIGISYDLLGDDIYRTGDFSFAALLGVNLHVDKAGNDIYKSGLFSQGAAIRGVSMLVEEQGRDSYSATGMAQGFGSVRAAGALMDFGGSDTYEVGGKYTHAPLMPKDFRSMGQGMGFGFRPDYAGGLGLLYDADGNDKYLGGVYAQGVGYWYAAGMLIDEGGNDVYNAVYYPQGSGIHLASGWLYDGGGDDAYYSRNGPGQGAGHDWGLGVLIDESGNDAYSIHGGNGLGLSNSVGIFVDKSGNDRYERSEAQNYGNAAFSRSTGGIGLFLDGGGKDSYPDSSKADGLSWKKGSFGIGKDLADSAVEAETPKTDIEMDEAPAADAPIKEIFAAASEWEVGSAVNRVKAAREIMLNRITEASEYALANKLDTKSGLEYRALEALTKGSADFKASLFGFVDDSDSLKAKNAMALIAGEQDSTLIVPIRKHLENNKYITACLNLLGSIKSAESVETLAKFAFHPSERYRYIVARSLKQIGTEPALKALENMAGDTSFLVKALIRKTREEKK